MNPIRSLLPCLIAILAFHACIPAARAEVRTWTAADGRTVRAEYHSATDSAVKVRLASNRAVAEIPLNKLSEADREWVTEKAAKENMPTPIEGEHASLITGDWALSQHGDLPFAFYAGADFSGDEKYPLLVVLHGKSKNNENGKQTGLARRFIEEENYAARPCFVLAPLCYQPHGASGNGWGDKPGEETLDLVETIAESLPVDPERIYLVGYSMGGMGVCDLMAWEPDLFAAAIAVAGCGHGEELKRKPVWLFHAIDDRSVDVESSRRFAEANKRSKVFKYTEWESGGHGIIGRVLDDPGVHEWLFEQRND